MTLVWDYDNKSSLEIAVWYKDEVQIGTLQKSSAPATINSEFAHKVKYVDRGAIELLDITQKDEGIYSFVVLYTISSGLPQSKSDVTVTVKGMPYH